MNGERDERFRFINIKRKIEWTEKAVSRISKTGLTIINGIEGNHFFVLFSSLSWQGHELNLCFLLVQKAHMNHNTWLMFKFLVEPENDFLVFFVFFCFKSWKIIFDGSRSREHVSHFNHWPTFVYFMAHRNSKMFFFF